MFEEKRKKIEEDKTDKIKLNGPKKNMPRPGFPKLFFLIAPLAKIFKIVPPFYSTYRPLMS